MLTSRCAAWPARFSSERPPPGRDWLLVFLADSEEEARAAAAEAAAAGFERGLFLEGGLPAYGHAARAQARPHPPQAQQTPMGLAHIGAATNHCDTCAVERQSKHYGLLAYKRVCALEAAKWHVPLADQKEGQGRIKVARRP